MTAVATECLTLDVHQLAARWGVHVETVRRAVRQGSSPVMPIMGAGPGRWVFSIAAIERAEMATLQRGLN